MPDPFAQWADSLTAPSQKPAKPAQAKPSPSPRPEKPHTLLGEASAGFRSELAEGLQAVSNIAGLPEQAAHLYSKSAKIPFADALREVQDTAGAWKTAIEPSPGEDQPQGLGEKIAYGLGKGAGQILTYGTAMRLLKGKPALAMALVDASKNLNKGPYEAGKAALIGGATGAAFGKLGEIESLPKRVAATAAAGAAAPALTGGSMSDVVAGGVLGGATGIFPSEKKSVEREAERTANTPVIPADRNPNKPTRRTKEGILVVDRPSDLIPLLDRLQSPSQAYASKPALRNLIFETIKANRNSVHLQERWGKIARGAFRSIGKEEGRRLIADYLDNPRYTLDNPPTDLSPRMQKAYVDLRNLTEEIRQHLISAMRQRGDMVPDDWGVPEGFWPHVFQGRWMVMHENRPIGGGWLAETQHEGIEHGKAWAAANNLDPSKIRVEYMEPGVNIGQEFKKRGGGRRFFGHLQGRSENMPGWIADPEGFYTYLDGSARFATMAPMRPKYRAALKYLQETDPESEYTKTFQAYANRQEGQPDFMTQALNRWWQLWVEHHPGVTKATGGLIRGAPYMTQRTLAAVRGVQTMMKLGISPIAVLQNLSQLPINVWPVLGSKYTGLAMKEYFSHLASKRMHPEGIGKWDWLITDELHIHDAVSKADEMGLMERARLYWPTELTKAPGYLLQEAVHFGLRGFSKVENLNRSVAAIGAYLKSHDAGESRDVAIRRALETEIRTNFGYNQDDIQPIMSNPFNRTALQFKTFWLKQLEFMFGLTKKDQPYRLPGETRGKEMGRFLIATALSSGLVGLPFSDEFGKLVKMITGYDYLGEFEQAHPKIARGVPAALPLMSYSYVDPKTGEEKTGKGGIDLSRNVGFGDYMDPFSLSPGPTVSEVIGLVKAVTANPGRDRKAAWDALARRVWPLAYRTKEALTDLQQKQGVLRDYKGRVITNDLDEGKRLALALGAIPLEIAIRRDEFNKLYEHQQEISSIEEGYVDDAVDAILQKQPDKAVEAIREGIRKGYTDLPQSVYSRLKNIVAIPREVMFMYRHRKQLAQGAIAEQGGLKTIPKARPQKDPFAEWSHRLESK